MTFERGDLIRNKKTGTHWQVLFVYRNGDLRVYHMGRLTRKTLKAKHLHNYEKIYRERIVL